MDDALWNALAVEMRHLFKQEEVLKHDRTTIADGKGVLVVANGSPCVRCHRLAYFFSHVILQDRES
jgi:hypothetical protein